MDDYKQRNSVVIQRILPFLDVASIISCSSTSKFYYRLINADNLLWKDLCRQQNIVPEQWDWQDKELWLFDAPCKWKRIFMNYKRTSFNMKNNKFKKYKIQEHFAGFDGKTLLFQTYTKLSIYKIIEDELVFFQNLELPTRSCMRRAQTKSNTDYIVVASDGHIVLYRLFNNEYTFFYKVAFSSNDPNSTNNDLKATNDFNAAVNFNRDLDLYVLVGNKLIIESPNCKLFIWHITQKKLLFESIGYSHIAVDNNTIYISNIFDGTIISFNENINYKIEITSPMYKFLIVENSIFLWNEGMNKTCCITRWDKRTGQMLRSSQLNIDYSKSISTVKYYSCDLFIVLSPSEKLTAYQLLPLSNSFIKLWKINLKRIIDDKVWSCHRLLNIFNTMSIIMEPPRDFVIRTLEEYQNKQSNTIIDFYNIKTGTILKSINVDFRSSLDVYDGVIISNLEFKTMANISNVSSVYLYR